MTKNSRHLTINDRYSPRKYISIISGTLLVALTVAFTFFYFFTQSHPVVAISDLISVSPTLGPISGGQTVTLTGSGFAPSQTFNYTGAYESYTAPISAYYKLEVWGAAGALAQNNVGGKGGYSVGMKYLNAGETIYVYAGGQGAGRTSVPTQGGWNGGGGYTSPHSNNDNGAGGGATDIRTVADADPLDPTSLASRIIVAGGGGGGVDNRQIDGAGGGSSGQDGQSQWDLTGTAYGGTQSAAGGCTSGDDYVGCGVGADLGVGASAGRAGGGGGYYGGGATIISGAGGSGYIGGVVSYYGIDAATTVGTNTGDGYAKITMYPATSITLDGVLATDVTIIDDSTVTFTTPPHILGRVDVEFDNIVDSGTLADAYTYSPTLTDVDPLTGPATGRNQIILTGDSFTCPIDETYYVTDDLVLWLDGVKNTTTGHNPSAPSWEDLSPSGNSMDIYAQTWGDNYLNVTRSTFTADDIPIDDGVFTIEVVERRPTFSYSAIGSSNTDALKLKLRALESDRPWWDNYSALRYTSHENPGRTNAWVYTSDGVTRKIYKNGVEEGSAAANPTATTDFGNFIIGSGEQFIGQMYAIRIYHRALTAEEVAQNAFADNCRFNDGYVHAVKIGDQVASGLKYIDGNHLEVTAPAGAVGLTDITLIDQYGNEIMQPIQYNYEPVLGSALPNFGAVGGNSMVMLMGGGFTTSPDNDTSASPTVDIGGQACTDVEVIDFYTLTCIAPASNLGADGTGTVPLTVTVAGQTTDPVDYSYVVFNVSPTEGSAVGGQSVEITGGPATCQLSTNNYVQKGLVFHLDGIDNAGFDTHFAGTVDTWTDLSIKGNDLIFNTSYSPYASWGDTHLNLTGIVPSNTLQDVPITNGEFTMEVALERPGYTYVQMGSQTSPQFWLKLRNSPTAMPWWDNASQLGYTFVDPLDTINHYAFSSDGTTRAIYFDGAVNRTSAANPSAATATFGRFSTGPTEALIGNLYAVRVYNRALSAQQIAVNHAIDNCRFNEGSYIKSVQFDGIDADFTVASDGKITATTPAHPGGLVDVTLVDILDNTITLTDAYEYIEWLDLEVLDPEITASLSPTSEDASSSGLAGLKVTTNHLTGYEIYIEADEALRHSDGAEFSRSDGTFAVPAALGINTWGTQITAQSTPPSMGGWIGVQVTAVKVFQQNIPSGALQDGEAPDELSLSAGVRGDQSLPAGQYSTEIMVTLVPRG